MQCKNAVDDTLDCDMMVNAKKQDAKKKAENKSTTRPCSPIKEKMTQFVRKTTSSYRTPQKAIAYQTEQ